jgi:hypothetical protein
LASFRGVVELGGLYREGRALPRPSKPWLIDVSVLVPYPGFEVGNTADYCEYPEMVKWTIGDTPVEKTDRLKWIVIGDGEKTLLICDRVILARVSWNDLDQRELVRGKTIAIDERLFLCRILTGGSHYRNKGDGYGGGAPKNNEWDRFVALEDQVEGLPTPEASDLDSKLDRMDRESAHNRFWNWMAMNSWTQEPNLEKHTARCCRGYRSAKFFYVNTFDHRHEDIGWRPVLELGTKEFEKDPPGVRISPSGEI